jgi:hypothetical protein
MFNPLNILMKHLLLVLLGLTAAAAAWALTKIDKPVYCDEPKTIISSLVGQDYQERPQWIGVSENNDSRYILMMNSTTKSWTLIQMNEKVACILGTGEKGTFAPNSRSYRTTSM